MPKLKDYKGYEIYVESDGIFKAMKDANDVASAGSLDVLEKKLDVLAKARYDLTVWVKAYERYKQGRLTSVQETGSRYGSARRFRVTTKAGGSTSWHDYDAESLVRDTEENRGILLKVHEKMDEIDRVKKEVEKLEKSLDKYKESELLG